MKPEKSNNTEQHIIEVARQMFIERGFSETSMSDIAARAGINRPALHYYFRTKELMFEAVFGDIIYSFIPIIHQIALQDKPISERISEITDIYFDIMLQNPSLPLFVIREIQRDANHLLNTVNKLGIGQYISKIKEVLQEGMKRGRIKQTPIEFVPYTFYGLLFAPFILKPITDIVITASPLNQEALIKEWKAQVAKQMCMLLCVD